MLDRAHDGRLSSGNVDMAGERHPGSIPPEHVSDALLRHELVHVRQAGELGVARFLWRYVAEYVRNRRRGMSHDAAYRAISFEAEAFAAEVDQPV